MDRFVLARRPPPPTARGNAAAAAVGLLPWRKWGSRNLWLAGLASSCTASRRRACCRKPMLSTSRQSVQVG
eukprot:365752-Chlamydomonas_euryale.AAC.3